MNEPAREWTPGAAACLFMMTMPMRRHTEGASSTKRDDLVSPTLEHANLDPPPSRPKGPSWETPKFTIGKI